MTKVFDTFIFGGHSAELDLLEVRLNELDGVVEKFVIVESPTTHLGNPKKLYFQENKERFSQFKDKIHYFITDPLNYGFPWRNENEHRNNILNGLRELNLNFEDWILISDLDEIPSKNSVKELIDRNDAVSLGIPLAYRPFFLNIEAGKPSVGVRAVRFSLLTPFSPQEIRNNNFTDYNTTQNNGWHFTYQGGKKAIKEKLESFAHGNDYDNRLGHQTKETSEEEINRDLDNLRIFGEHPVSKDWKKLEINENTLPKYVVDNQDKFKTWLL